MDFSVSDLIKSESDHAVNTYSLITKACYVRSVGKTPLKSIKNGGELLNSQTKSDLITS